MADTKKKATRGPAARRAGGASARGNRYTAENLGEGALAVQGDYNKVEYKHITYVYGNTPRSVEEEGELKRLREVVSQKIAELKSAVAPRRPSSGNPYHLLEALNVHERDHLAGRESALRELAARLDDKGFAALSGGHGIGKTSLLRAGLIPELVDAGHWPIRIEVGSEAADAAIKKAVFGSLEGFSRLAAHPLRDVLQLASAFVPDEKDIVLLVDNLEELFQQPAERQAEFVQVWKECINDPGLNARWAFCVSGVTHHLSQFQSGEINPFANLTLLGPLDRAAAEEAIASPARAAGIKIEQALVKTLVDELGGDEVEPARLQIVCHTLAGGAGPVQREITLADYERAERLDGLLRTYLNEAIGQVSLEERDAAWQTLSLLEEENQPTPAREIERQLSSFGYRELKFDSLLDTLEVKHLVILQEAGYRLASESWRRPIREWRKREAVPRQVQKEAARQMQRVRNSALRGLVGGSVGFGLFTIILYTFKSLDNLLLYGAFLVILNASIGGIGAFILTLTADLARATRQSSRPWQRYLAGGASGAAAYVVVMALYTFTLHNADAWLRKIPAALFEGAAWGFALGLGLMWALETRKRKWAIIGVTALVCGILLMGTDWVGAALINELFGENPSSLRIFLAGALAPLFYLVAALADQPET
ncbi:MAG: hypothetical protein AB1750_03210 [Chloroflexota bacterium]